MKKTSVLPKTEKVQKRQKANVIAGVITGGILAVVLIAAILFPGFFGLSKVKASVTVEAGVKTIAVGDFIKSEVSEASFATDLSTINLSMPGTYKIEILADGRTYTSNLAVIDTIVPTATAVDRDINESASLKPDDFVTDVIDATAVTARFANEPPFGQPGEHVVAIILTDLGGNQTMLSASLRISN